jgi:hypothetical protein
MSFKCFVFVTVLLLCLTSVPLMAQDDDACPVLVEEALAAVDDACAGIDRNQVCYGHNLVAVTRFDNVSLDDFTDTGDTIDITQLASLVTAPMDVNENIWGVAMMALQVNLPDTLPGQNVTFIIYGDAELHSETLPEGVSYTCTATPGGNMNLRGGPGTNFAVVGGLAGGQEATVIGKNTAGDWLCLEGEDKMWVYEPLVNTTCTIELLPTYEGDEVTVPEPAADYTAPMQAFRFTSGIGETACEEAPKDGLLVQAPTGTTVHFMINGVEVEVGSTALLLINEDLLGVNTFDGAVSVTAAGETQTAEPGYQVIAADDVPPTEPEPYDYDNVRAAPVNLLPEPVSIPVAVPADSGWTTPRGGWTLALLSTPGKPSPSLPVARSMCGATANRQ